MAKPLALAPLGGRLASTKSLRSQFSMSSVLNCGRYSLDLSRPCVMGIVNVTPDSFSDGGDFLSLDAARRHAERLVNDGAAILDIGGESTRPGAEPVTVAQEIDRVVPLIESIAATLPVPISIDTTKPLVMRAAIAAGAGMINAIDALRTPGAVDTATELKVPVCLMHMQGEPRTMQHNPLYDDVVAEVHDFLAERLAVCEAAGIERAQLIIDPGFGFGKTLAHNRALLAHLDDFKTLNAPLLVGLSRKSMLGALSNAAVDQRLPESLAAAVLAVERGAQIVRVHDVAATVRALRVVEWLH